MKGTDGSGGDEDGGDGATAVRTSLGSSRGRRGKRKRYGRKSWERTSRRAMLVERGKVVCLRVEEPTDGRLAAEHDAG